ncbi:hypothetical protein V2E67_001912 [Citrobacter freundii]|nr:hypothetical protein [Citrobacter freundii]
MRIFTISAPGNIVNENSESDNIRSLSKSCQLPKENASDSIRSVESEGVINGENKNTAGMQTIMMATMVSQYRIEAILGGDQDQEDNPMYISDW